MIYDPEVLRLRTIRGGFTMDDSLDGDALPLRSDLMGVTSITKSEEAPVEEAEDTVSRGG